MATCDLCGAKCKASELEQLLGQYQTAGVVDLCGDCIKWANKTKGDLIDTIAPGMRKAIADRKGGVSPPGLFRRIFMRHNARLTAPDTAQRKHDE